MIGRYLVALLLAMTPGVLKDFDNLPEDCTVESVGNRIVDQFLTSDPMKFNPKGFNGYYKYGHGRYVHYAVVSLWVNSLEFADRMSNAPLLDTLVNRFEPFYSPDKKYCNASNHVDYCIFGALPLEISVLTGDKRAEEYGLYYADHQWMQPDSLNLGDIGNLSYAKQMEFYNNGYSPQTRLWIDDMYMINVLQTQAYRLTGDRKYIDRAAREMVMYLETIQNPDGLFYHAEGIPFVWGRGDGWMAAGMPMILKYLPKDSPYYKPIKAGYLKMMATLLKYQRQNGMWGQIVTDAESWDETSCTAMFAYAFIEGVKRGWLKRSVYGPAARKAWIALCARLDDNANLADVCTGTAAKDSRDWYLERQRVNGDPHGQAPMLWICNSILEGRNMPGVAETDVSLFVRNDSLQVSEFFSQEKDMYRKMGHHGPAVETAYMALRLYFNDSGAIDVYSKSGRRQELRKFLWYPDAEQRERGAGCDEYYVGKTLGLGGVALWDGNDIVRLLATKGRQARVGKTVNGHYAEMIHYGVPYKSTFVDVSVRVDVEQGSRDAVVTARCLTGDKLRFVTGVNFNAGAKVDVSRGYISVWGVHPSDVSSNPVPIGGGMCYKEHLFSTLDYPGMKAIVSRPCKFIKTKVVSASAKENWLNNAEAFADYVCKMNL